MDVSPLPFASSPRMWSEESSSFLVDEMESPENPRGSPRLPLIVPVVLSSPTVPGRDMDSHNCSLSLNRICHLQDAVDPRANGIQSTCSTICRRRQGDVVQGKYASCLTLVIKLLDEFL